MHQIAIAFATTGPSPRDGHRISELVAVEQGTGRRLHFAFDAEGDKSFAALFPALNDFIGKAPVVVLNGGQWRRFLRAELKAIRIRGARRLLNQIVDVGAWAHQRFPRQRKDVAAIARRMGIEVEKDLTGLELEAELLRLIAAGMNTSSETVATSVVAVVPLVAVSGVPEVAAVLPVVQVRRNWVERVGCFWRMLTGRM